eukprot:jgi/Mesvir1/20826/Mv07923-RA.1
MSGKVLGLPSVCMVLAISISIFLSGLGAVQGQAPPPPALTEQQCDDLDDSLTVSLVRALAPLPVCVYGSFDWDTRLCPVNDCKQQTGNCRDPCPCIEQQVIAASANVTALRQLFQCGRNTIAGCPVSVFVEYGQQCGFSSRINDLFVAVGVPFPPPALASSPPPPPPTLTEQQCEDLDDAVTVSLVRALAPLPACMFGMFNWDDRLCPVDDCKLQTGNCNDPCPCIEQQLIQVAGNLSALRQLFACGRNTIAGCPVSVFVDYAAQCGISNRINDLFVAVGVPFPPPALARPPPPPGLTQQECDDLDDAVTISLVTTLAPLPACMFGLFEWDNRLCPVADCKLETGNCNDPCPCIEQQVIAVSNNVSALRQLYQCGRDSIGGCPISVFVEYGPQCGLTHRINDLFVAVGVPFPPPPQGALTEQQCDNLEDTLTVSLVRAVAPLPACIYGQFDWDDQLCPAADCKQQTGNCRNPCPCIEQQVIAASRNVTTLRQLFDCGRNTIAGCPVSVFVDYAAQCGFSATINSLFTAVGVPFPPPFSLSPPSPPPSPSPPPRGPLSEDECDELDGSVTISAVRVLAPLSICAYGVFEWDDRLCPAASCKQQTGNCRNPCPCIEQQVIAVSGNVSALQLLFQCGRNTIAGCPVSVFVDYAAQCGFSSRINDLFVAVGIDGLVRKVPLLPSGPVLDTPSFKYSERGQGGVPPSPMVAVGPDHLITIVRSQFNRAIYRVYVKEPWLPVKQSFLTQFHRSNTICRTGPFVGAPNVVYDHLADRWLIMEVARNGTSGAYFLCMLFSLSGIPYGLLYRGFAIPLAADPGDMAFTVMPDGYYFATYEDPPAVHAINRVKLLSSNTLDPVVRVVAPALPGYLRQGLMPGHLGGFTRQDVSCGFFVRPVDDELHVGSPDSTGDSIEVWQFCPSFGSVEAASVTLVADVRVQEFSASVCNSAQDAACLAQPGSAVLLNTYHQSMTRRAGFRSFASHDSLLATFTVDGGNGRAAVMWVELRRNLSLASVPGAWAKHQDGILAPEGRHAWLPAAAMDRSNNIVVGYSGLDATRTIYPSLYYTGRTATTPPGTMSSPETLLIAGTTNATSSSFGGRSVMAVDPRDGCSFYHLGPWQTSTSRSATYIASVRFPGCRVTAACSGDTDCNDGQFCTLDKCRDGQCVNEPDIMLCRFGEVCNEVTDVCEAAA